MEQELKDQQKRIEDKLDILLAAMSVHPEFGNLVKQGKRELYKAEKSEEIKKKIQDYDRARLPTVISYLGTWDGQSSKLAIRLKGIKEAKSAGIARINPAEVEKEQLKAVEEALGDRERYPDLANFMDARIGKPIILEKELNLIMEEYDRQQETNEQNA